MVLYSVWIVYPKYGYMVVSDVNEFVQNTDVHRFQRKIDFDDQQSAVCIDYTK